MRRQHAAAAVIFLVLSVAFTWPLAWNLDRAVSDPGDPYLNLWILDWDWYATFHAPLSLFHAPAFHPARYSLAFSENLYGVAVLLFPFRLIGLSALTTYNLGMLLGFAFCGFGAYLLGRRLTDSWIAGMAAGVFYAFVPFRFTQLSHIQHIWGGWLPLLLVALLAYAERPTRKRALIFAAVFVMNGLTNIHYLFFGALATAITALLLLPRAHWRALAIATGFALLILAPFLYPYAVVAELYGMQRTAEEVLRFSAVPADWLPDVEEPERRLFPGWIPYALGAMAFVVARRRKAQLSLALLWILLGFLGSLGLNFVFHEFLFGGVPGFRAIRVPARWAVIAYIGLAMLLALLTVELLRHRRWWWTGLLVPVLLGWSLWQAPIRWYLPDPDPPAVYRWLKTANVRAVAELPMDSLSSDYDYLLHSTAHRKPIVNGISGFAPPQRIEFSRLSRESPEAFLDALQAAGVDTLIVHADRLGGESQRIRDWLRLELDRGRIAFVNVFPTLVDGDWVFRIGRRGARPRVLEAWLAGGPTCSSETMGALDFPPSNINFDKGQAIFSGWTIAPHGVKSVDLYFDNRTVRRTATLTPDATLDARCPGQRMHRTRFLLQYSVRPCCIAKETDVQVEVTDGRGVRTPFDQRWITWD
ncbi:MAG TPA: hypothetical protein VEK11_04785 [Thermoanaerobaculia bacterium]|nr:hypothetical protein [Thermoanaerobaculia bacterium]